MTRNERTRAAAVKAGRATYLHEVVDLWPACATCASPIRWNVDVGRPGLWRTCGCDGVAWVCGVNGWERRALDERMNESSVNAKGGP